MKHWSRYKGHEPDTETVLNKKGIPFEHDATIYTLDIETTSYFVDKYGLIHPACEYLKYHSEKKKEDKISYIGCCMYIWMFGINDIVYYGRTKKELISFMKLLPDYEKIVWIHNLSFEFEFLQDILKFTKVFARKAHKPIWTRSEVFPDIEFRCSYLLSNSKLENLPKNFGFDVHKKTGGLDYNMLRTYKTPLTVKELLYCEYDCLVLYEYIKREHAHYGTLKNIPHTATGKVRRSLHETVDNDLDYKNKLHKCIDVLPTVYNDLMSAYAGGYTHANRMYAGDILHDVISFDFTSSYPYVLISEKYPMKKFAVCKRKITVEEILKNKENYAYLIHLRIDNLKSKCYNTFISVSKCLSHKGTATDNGRIISAEYAELMITETDLEYIVESYSGDYTILDCKYAHKEYLPKILIDFILDYYVKKTEYKNVAGMETVYNRIKSDFNSIYGMCVTNDICDMVEYENGIWKTVPCNIWKKLLKKEKDAFLSPAFGVWVCSYARRNLILNVIKNDQYVVYCDTDSMKLVPGFDMDSINNYNNIVKEKLQKVAEYYNIDSYRFNPVDHKGKSHMIGLFDFDGQYSEFVTLGAKKYAVREDGKLKITVAGVPKEGVKALKDDISNFEEGLIFTPEHMKKLTHVYVDNLPPVEITDYLGNTAKVNDKCGVALVPATYVLGQSSLKYTGTANERYYIDI